MNIATKIKSMSFYIVYKDIQNYREWMKLIDKEKANPKSLYNKFNMKHNMFYVLYFPLGLKEEDKDLPDNIKRLRIVELLAPVHRYIDEELQFAEYIMPEFNQFYDEEGKPTLFYGIVYRFAFKRLSLKYVITRLIGLGLLTWGIIEFYKPIINLIFN